MSDSEVIERLCEMLQIDPSVPGAPIQVLERVGGLSLEVDRWIERVKKLEERNRLAVEALSGALARMDLAELLTSIERIGS